MTTNRSATAALFDAAELSTFALFDGAFDGPGATAPVEVVEEASAAPADDRPALTLTHFERTCALGGRHAIDYTFATEAEAAEFPARMSGLRGAELDVYGEIRKVETTYRVGDKVTVRAFGQPNRPGVVTKLGRTKVAVDFLRNQSGRRHEGTFSAVDVRPA
jgi:hypothetical protein